MNDAFPLDHFLGYDKNHTHTLLLHSHYMYVYYI